MRFRYIEIHKKKWVFELLVESFLVGFGVWVVKFKLKTETQLLWACEFDALLLLIKYFLGY